MVKAKSKSKKSGLKKAVLGATAAAVMAGAGGQAAQAGWGLDMVKGAASDMFGAGAKVMTGTAKLAMAPLASAAAWMKWGYENPKKATAVAFGAVLGTAALTWAGLTYKDELAEAGSKLFNQANEMLQPMKDKIADFFGGSKAYDAAQEFADGIKSIMQSYMTSFSEGTIHPAEDFVKQANATTAQKFQETMQSASDWWAQPSNIPVYVEAFQRSLTDNYVAATIKMSQALEALQKVSSHAVEYLGNTTSYYTDVGSKMFNDVLSSTQTKVLEGLHLTQEAASKVSAAVAQQTQAALDVTLEAAKVTSNAAAEVVNNQRVQDSVFSMMGGAFGANLMKFKDAAARRAATQSGTSESPTSGRS